MKNLAGKPNVKHLDKLMLIQIQSKNWPGSNVGNDLGDDFWGGEG